VSGKGIDLSLDSQEDWGFGMRKGVARRMLRRAHEHGIADRGKKESTGSKGIAHCTEEGITERS